MEYETCVVCGGKQIKMDERPMSITGPYTSPVVIYLRGYKCLECGSTIADDDACDIAIAEGHEKMRKASMINMITTLNREGYSDRMIESAANLAQGTVIRWKGVDSPPPSAAAVALMRIIRTYPWMIGVAENEYDLTEAKRAVLAGASDFIELMNETDEAVAEPKISYQTKRGETDE